MTNLKIEKKQKRSLITTAISMVVVIVLLVVAIVVVALDKNGDQGIVGIENGEFTIVSDEQKTTETKAEESKRETKVVTITTDATKAAEKETLPQTGAEDLLPLALVLGVLTTGATALALHKREA